MTTFVAHRTHSQWVTQVNVYGGEEGDKIYGFEQINLTPRTTHVGLLMSTRTIYNSKCHRLIKFYKANKKQ